MQTIRCFWAKVLHFSFLLNKFTNIFCCTSSKCSPSLSLTLHTQSLFTTTGLSCRWCHRSYWALNTLFADKSKSQTNNIRNPPTTINNADKRTHSNISTPKSDSFVEQSSNQYKRPQTQALISHANAANYVPTGMDFFESLWKQNLYQTITLPPPVSYDTQQFIASPPIPNKISRSFIEYDAEAMDTNQHEQTDKFIPQLDHSFYRGPSERMLPFEHTPHMIKFTLDDAIKRDNIDYENLTAVYGPGPVTVAPEGHQLFDPNLIDNQQPDVSEIYPEIRQMRQNFHSSHELSNDNMNLGELQMTSTGATTSKHPSTIAVKLPLPSKKLMARHGAPYRGHIKFGAKLKPFEKSQKFFDNKYSASNVNDELASNNWEPIATPSVISTGIPSMSDNPDIEITKENIVELMPDMFEENITPIIDHQQQTTTNQKKREHKDNTLEVSGVYSKQRHQGSSAETADIIYGYGKPQHIPFILNQPVGRIPKASITEYRAPTLYVPVRHHRPTIERHPDDVAFSPAKRLERIKSVSKPRADITKYFQWVYSTFCNYIRLSHIKSQNYSAPNHTLLRCEQRHLHSSNDTVPKWIWSCYG